MRTRASILLSCLLSVSACRERGAAEPEAPGEGGAGEGGAGEGSAGEEGAGEEPASAEGEVVESSGATVRAEIPAALTGDLRQQGADADGRLLTLAPGFIAAVACSDCGAPTYLRFVAVRCTDDLHCEVLTEQCEGAVSRGEDEVVTVELEAVEGVEAPELCEGYSGSFEAK